MYWAEFNTQVTLLQKERTMDKTSTTSLTSLQKTLLSSGTCYCCYLWFNTTKKATSISEIYFSTVLSF